MDLKHIIAENIAGLRKAKKWTQAELAEKVNYTDKAVSKWERGESTPDVDALKTLADLFNVQIDYFFHEKKEEKIKFVKRYNNTFVKRLLIMLLLNVAVLFVAAAIFVFAHINHFENANEYWISFVWMVPIMSLVTLSFMRTMNYKFGALIALSVCLWSFLTCGYLTTLLSELNFWMLFLVGVPIEASLILIYFIRKQ